MQQRKILLLENVATQAAGVREHLAQAGFQVAVSRYESDGLKRLVEWGPDVVLVSTAHPAGDFVEYCRRARALAPTVRIIVTSSLNRDRLFKEHPGLQTIVDGVLLRPYSREEVSAMLAPAAAAPPAAAVAPAVDPGGTALRAEFQRQLDARFLEIEELKRHLEVASRRAASAPGLEWLQSENEHLRQGVEETRKKAVLALATEQLKRSEIEVKLDNLLRMKEDFEFRAQNELEDRNREIELVRGQLEEVRARFDKEAGEHAALRVEMERELVEKEQIEERLHALETGGSEAAATPDAPQADAPRLAALETELSNQRALAAEGQVALADLAAKAAVLEESRAREVAARTQELLESVAAAERRNEQLQSACTELEERFGASEATRISVEGEAVALRTKAENLSGEIERLRASRTAALSASAVQDTERRVRELTEDGDRVRELTSERDRLTGLLEERQQAVDAEVLAWREQAAAAARQLEDLRSQQEQSALAQREELRRRTESSEQAALEREESKRLVASLRGELAAAVQTHERETKLLTERASAAAVVSRETSGRLEVAEAALVAARQGFEARERELRFQLESLQASSREIEEKLAARAVQEAGANQVRAELHRIQELLEEVIAKARTEAVDYARRDADLSARLQAALDERRQFQERFDRASAEATERERRSSSLLQSAIDRGPSPMAERANLPAVVPLNSGDSGTPRRWPVPLGLAVLTLAVLLAAFGLRRGSPPAVREQLPAVQRPQPGASRGAARSAALSPGEVWDRWTRSDGSGGVLVQATLRSEEELRAEIEAERARGLSDEEVRVQLARRLSAFHFDTTYYMTVYLKNLAPGYPAYLDDLAGRFRLRDGSGKETPAFLPQGHEKDRRIFSFGAGAPGDVIYEASVSLGFDRASLSPAAGYLQLVVSDVGAASRRVLTWELE